MTTGTIGAAQSENRTGWIIPSFCIRSNSSSTFFLSAKGSVLALWNTVDFTQLILEHIVVLVESQSRPSRVGPAPVTTRKGKASSCMLYVADTYLHASLHLQQFQSAAWSPTSPTSVVASTMLQGKSADTEAPVSNSITKLVSFMLSSTSEFHPGPLCLDGGTSGTVTSQSGQPPLLSHLRVCALDSCASHGFQCLLRLCFLHSVGVVLVRHILAMCPTRLQAWHVAVLTPVEACSMFPVESTATFDVTKGHLRSVQTERVILTLLDLHCRVFTAHFDLPLC